MACQILIGAQKELDQILVNLRNYANNTSISYQERYKELLTYSGSTGNYTVYNDLFDRNPVIQNALEKYNLSKDIALGDATAWDIYKALRTDFLVGLNNIMANEILVIDDETGEQQSVYIDPQSQEAADALIEAEKKLQQQGSTGGGQIQILEYATLPEKYITMYNNKEYLTMDLDTLITNGTEIRNLLKENKYTPEDETLLRQLLTKINDMINSIRNNPGTPDEWLEQAQNYIDSAEPTVSEDRIAEAAVRIGQILITAAAIIFPVIALILGIKYFIAGPDDKGRLKTQLIGFITAAVITFGAYTIWKIAYAIINNILQ